MSPNGTIPRRLAAATALGAAVLATVLVPAGAAQAATPGQFTLCSDGYYSSYAEFPERHFATKVVNPGTCATISVTGRSKDVVVLRQANGAVIGDFSFDDATGTGVSTTGYAWSAGYYRW
ncbi:hypothetical protein ACFVHB_21120 [Kitasatospora sp. NPDC127111]|uniref:hypothetical protein n=1 Tax=Kitasatospora sp. NPDC127111 TaxID=3345363 RepID=UPI00362EED3D